MITAVFNTAPSSPFAHADNNHEKNESAGNIAAPFQVGDRWRKTHKNPVNISKIIREIKKPFQQLYAPIDIIFNRAKKLKQAQREYPTVWSLGETMDRLIRGASICRYGDGEFRCLHSLNIAAPQSAERILAQRLAEALATPTTEQLIIAIPPFNSKYNTKKNQYGWLNFWENYWSVNWDWLRNKLMNRTFGNSFVSRADVFYEVDIEKIRSIWADRDVVFVVGRNSRFFDEPRLFGSMASAEFLFVEPTRAYVHYDAVLQQALAFEKSKLFVICAGFMATVLAFDLHHHGYQALDMGHFPNCYREYLQEAPRPEWLPEVIERKPR